MTMEISRFVEARIFDVCMIRGSVRCRRWAVLLQHFLWGTNLRLLSEIRHVSVLLLFENAVVAVGKFVVGC